jgi:acetolactate synthase-1/2/3 large subunit
VCGDGDFMMASTELATIVQHNVPIVICIFNNSVYGTIRMHQARDYPGRRSGTELVNPDFAALAESYGIAANTVSTAKDFISAFKAGLESEGPLLIHVQQDPDDIAPGRTLTQLEARK